MLVHTYNEISFEDLISNREQIETEFVKFVKTGQSSLFRKVKHNKISGYLFSNYVIDKFTNESKFLVVSFDEELDMLFSGKSAVVLNDGTIEEKAKQFVDTLNFLFTEEPTVTTGIDILSFLMDDHEPKNTKVMNERTKMYSAKTGKSVDIAKQCKSELMFVDKDEIGLRKRDGVCDTIPLTDAFTAEQLELINELSDDLGVRLSSSDKNELFNILKSL